MVYRWRTVGSVAQHDSIEAPVLERTQAGANLGEAKEGCDAKQELPSKPSSRGRSDREDRPRSESRNQRGAATLDGLARLFGTPLSGPPSLGWSD
jgi:hypothetical protein